MEYRSRDVYACFLVNIGIPRRGGKTKWNTGTIQRAPFDSCWECRKHQSIGAHPVVPTVPVPIALSAARAASETGPKPAIGPGTEA